MNLKFKSLVFFLLFGFITVILNGYSLKGMSGKYTSEISVLRYTIFNNPPTLSMIDVQEVMLKAFDLWSTFIMPGTKWYEVLYAERHKYPIVFNVSFESGNHKNLFFFDMPFTENLAGHAIRGYYFHFNKDIQWRKYCAGEKVDYISTDFYSIALFTVGQFYGWEVSDNETSIMFKGYKDSVDANGNYIEPKFSEYDRNYSLIKIIEMSRSFIETYFGGSLDAFIEKYYNLTIEAVLEKNNITHVSADEIRNFMQSDDLA